jgi:hypothetical protein
MSVMLLICRAALAGIRPAAGSHAICSLAAIRSGTSLCQQQRGDDACEQHRQQAADQEILAARSLLIVIRAPLEGGRRSQRPARTRTSAGARPACD